MENKKNSRNGAVARGLMNAEIRHKRNGRIVRAHDSNTPGSRSHQEVVFKTAQPED